LRTIDGALDLSFGQPYVDDEVLLQHSHVPVRYHHAHPEVVPASFHGGTSALSNWLGSHQRYPDFAVEQQISGESIVQFTVEPSGVLSNIEISTNASPSLDYEAIRVTRNMPLWKSGEKEGKEVRTVNQLPYRFTLR
jgi:protein TonB